MNHVSLGFAQKKDTELLAFGEGVHDAFVANPTVVTGCPVTAATLDTANKDFSVKIAATKEGGKTSTVDKNASREALLGLLRQIAAWLEGKAMGNVDTITLLAFESTSHSPNAQTPLSKPAILAVLNNMTTQLQLQVTSVTNAHAYELQNRTGTGGWQAVGSFPQARSMVVTNLVPGTLYEFRVRAIGGSTGFSDWSDLVAHMAT